MDIFSCVCRDRDGNENDFVWDIAEAVLGIAVQERPEAEKASEVKEAGRHASQGEPPLDDETGNYMAGEKTVVKRSFGSHFSLGRSPDFNLELSRRIKETYYLFDEQGHRIKKTDQTDSYYIFIRVGYHASFLDVEEDYYDDGMPTFESLDQNPLNFEVGGRSGHLQEWRGVTPYVQGSVDVSQMLYTIYRFIDVPGRDYTKATTSTPLMYAYTATILGLLDHTTIGGGADISFPQHDDLFLTMGASIKGLDYFISRASSAIPNSKARAYLGIASLETSIRYEF